MKSITLSEMQDTQMKMLKFLHRICVENHLAYYLYGGTLLGAIRHQGFIPWDDDLDIVVPRKDYETLLNILKDSNEYKLLSYEYVEDYYYPFAKLVDPATKLVEDGMPECADLGVWIDIFPLDQASDSALIRKIHIFLLKKLVGLNRYAVGNKNRVDPQVNTAGKKIKKFIANRCSSHKTIKLIHAVAGIFKNKSTNYLMDSTWGMHLAYDSSWFGKPVPVLFGEEKYYAPYDSDAILKAIFGDYMQLPPEEKRHANHNYSCWWKE